MSRPKNEHFMLNFDLSVEALEKYYPKKHYRQAWRDIVLRVLKMPRADLLIIMNGLLNKRHIKGLIF